MTMPFLDTTTMDTDAARFVGEITTRKGALLTRRPMRASGDAQYVWRMVAFVVSPRPEHHCMPMMADCYIDGDYATRKRRRVELDEIVDRIVDVVPVHDWHGTQRWARVWGQA